MALGTEIQDPEETYSGSKVIKHRIPDLDPQHDK
jgi:hypothetical protein